MSLDLDWTHLATAGGTGGVIYVASKLIPAVGNFLSNERKSRRDDRNAQGDEYRKEAAFLQESYEKWISVLESNLKDSKKDMDEKEKSRIQLMVDNSLKDMDIKIMNKKLIEQENELSRLRGKS